MRRTSMSRANDGNAFVVVGLAEANYDVLLARCRDVLANEIRPDWQLAMSTVQQSRQLDARGSAQVQKGRDRCAHRAACEEHVVDKNDALVGYVEWNRGRQQLRRSARIACVIVPVE